MNAPALPTAAVGAPPDALPDADAAPLAAAIVVGDGAVDVDRLLAEVAAGQQSRGRRVRGLLMTYPTPERAGCESDLVLVDIETRDEYLVSQFRGPGAKACRADSQGFARASGVLRRALEAPGCDLVVCNRYGSLEAEGEGFADELLAIMAAGVPLLTAVNRRYLDAWRRFSGGRCEELPADAAAVTAWVETALARAGR